MSLVIVITGESKDFYVPTLSPRLNAILHEWVSPVLEANGFHKFKHVYEKKLEGLSWLVEIQQSRWNDGVESQFTVNCGVFIPGIMPLYLDRPERSRLDITDCCVHVRIGALAKDRLDKWWKLRIKDDTSVTDYEVGKELTERLSKDAFPFFSRFQNPEQVLRFLTNARSKEDKSVWPQAATIAYCYAAVLASLLKKSQSVQEYLEKAITASQGCPVEQLVARLTNRLNP